MKKKKIKTKTKKYNHTEAVAFIPYTPGSKLRKELQEWENDFAKTLNIKKIKFIKTGGTKIKQLIVKDPWRAMDVKMKSA